MKLESDKTKKTLAIEKILLENKIRDLQVELAATKAQNAGLWVQVNKLNNAITAPTVNDNN